MSFVSCNIGRIGKKEKNIYWLWMYIEVFRIKVCDSLNFFINILIKKRKERKRE